MKRILVFLASGLLFVPAAWGQCAGGSCGGGVVESAPVADMGVGMGDRCGYANSLWDGYCSEGVCCGRTGRGLFGGMCGMGCGRGPTVGAVPGWFGGFGGPACGFGGGGCGMGAGCGGGIPFGGACGGFGASAGLPGCGAACGRGCGFGDRMRHGFARRSWMGGACLDPCGMTTCDAGMGGSDCHGCNGGVSSSVPATTTEQEPHPAYLPGSETQGWNEGEMSLPNDATVNPPQGATPSTTNGTVTPAAPANGAAPSSSDALYETPPRIEPQNAAQPAGESSEQLPESGNDFFEDA